MSTTLLQINHKTRISGSKGVAMGINFQLMVVIIMMKYDSNSNCDEWGSRLWKKNVQSGIANESR